jgi:peptidoglycan/LPS O-acetylase OafA/YrhL
LGIGYFALGHPIFTNPAPSDALAPVLLLAFSFVRTALCIAIILSLVTFCRSRKTEPSPLTRKVAAISYEMYLVHIFFVVFLQNVLMVWQAGPPMAKSLIVFLAVFPLSYWVSRVIHKFPRSFIMGFCALFFLVLCATL